MKKLVLALFLVVALMVPMSVFATDINTNTFIPTNTNVNTPINTNTFVPVNTDINTNTNLNTNLNAQGQLQGQGQSQKQDQNQHQSQSSVNVNDNTNISKSSAKANSASVNAGNQQIVESTQQLLPNMTIFPLPVPLIQGGRVGDVTAQMPKFAYAGLKPLGKDDAVLDLKVKSGSIFDRVRLEDIELDLIAFYKDTAKTWNPSKIRYLVQYKDSASGFGIGGGIGGGGSGITNGGVGAQGVGAILPSAGRSTADPQYILKLFLIQ
jgi:hypothetical protein